MIDIFHLQNSVKATPEIDAVFLLTHKTTAGIEKALVTFEAKRKDPILIDQLRAQVAYMAYQCTLKPALRDIKSIISIAGRSDSRNSKRFIGLFEMEAVDVVTAANAYDTEQEHLLSLNILTKVAYKFKPTVSGI